uniref:FAM192A/Fyv6 N-terminal domain-containing protein n=1 Tax=Kalanchoe fedtschenkoi TaxID=63787 RepID=A0A7N0UU71_KALFE
MAEEPPHPPVRLMNFVSEEQLDEVKRTRGERVEDGTAQRDRPLFEILKENKDKKDAEFNERFKHRPPKALDEDETEFLDTLEMSRREYEKKLARDEEMQLRSFQAAVAAQSNIVRELKEAPPDPVAEVPKKEQNPAVKKNVHSRPVNVIIKVKPQAKKAKTDQASAEEQPSESIKALDTGAQMAQCKAETPNGNADSCNTATKLGLVSYSDESDDD